MIFAYALLGVTEFREQAASVLERATEIWAPDILRAELANVVWQWIEFREVPMATGVAVLRDAESLLTGVFSAELLAERALELSVAAHHPVYDTLFIALAERLGFQVVSFDERLKSAFPASVLTPAEFLAP